MSQLGTKSKTLIAVKFELFVSKVMLWMCICMEGIVLGLSLNFSGFGLNGLSFGLDCLNFCGLGLDFLGLEFLGLNFISPIFWFQFSL